MKKKMKRFAEGGGVGNDVRQRAAFYAALADKSDENAAQKDFIRRVREAQQAEAEESDRKRTASAPSRPASAPTPPRPTVSQNRPAYPTASRVADAMGEESDRRERERQEAEERERKPTASSAPASRPASSAPASRPASAPAPAPAPASTPPRPAPAPTPPRPASAPSPSRSDDDEDANTGRAIRENIRAAMQRRQEKEEEDTGRDMKNAPIRSRIIPNKPTAVDINDEEEGKNYRRAQAARGTAYVSGSEGEDRGPSTKQIQQRIREQGIETAFPEGFLIGAAPLAARGVQAAATGLTRSIAERAAARESARESAREAARAAAAEREAARAAAAREIIARRTASSQQDARAAATSARPIDLEARAAAARQSAAERVAAARQASLDREAARAGPPTPPTSVPQTGGQQQMITGPSAADLARSEQAAIARQRAVEGEARASQAAAQRREALLRSEAEARTTTTAAETAAAQQAAARRAAALRSEEGGRTAAATAETAARRAAAPAPSGAAASGAAARSPKPSGAAASGAAARSPKPSKAGKGGPSRPRRSAKPEEPTAKKRGGMIRYAAGGKVGASRGDGIAQRGKTRGKYL